MYSLIKSAWAAFQGLLFRNPARAQVAAACWRKRGKGKEILLITSRDTKRWILPKGWPIEGLSGAGSAQQEAWEEAGVKPARTTKDPIGSYSYEKGLKGNKTVTCITQVYDIKVASLADKYPEKHQRDRAWVSPKVAANMVDEPDLKALLKDF